MTAPMSDARLAEIRAEADSVYGLGIVGMRMMRELLHEIDRLQSADRPMSDTVFGVIDAHLSGSCIVPNCPDPCTSRVVTPPQARAMLAEIKKLRALAAQLGTPKPEYRFTDPGDGYASDYDMHAVPWCGCRREVRDVYSGPWRPVVCRSCGEPAGSYGDPPLCSNCANYGSGLATGGYISGLLPRSDGGGPASFVVLPSRAQIEQQASKMTINLSPAPFSADDFIATLRQAIRRDPTP